VHERAVPSVRPFLSLALLIAILASPLAAHAQGAETDDEAAHRHFTIGQANYANGGFETAAVEFDEAYRLSHRPELLYNVYVAHRDAGHRLEAAAALRQYLELVPDAANAAALRARLTVMEAELAASTETSEPEPTEAPVPTPHTTTPSPVGWIVGGIGAAALVASVITGVLALEAQSSLNDACGPTHDACPSDFDATVSAGRAYAAATDGLLIGGGLALGAGIALLFVLTDESGDAPPLTASCGPTGCAAFVHGRF
jgi:hypothetical protein